MGKLAEKIAIVTGAGSGIGRGIACGLAKEGAKVVIAGRRADKLRETAIEIEGLGGISLSVETDVTDESQVGQLFRRALDAFDRLDLLINNAGLVDGCALDALTFEAWNKVIA